MNKLTLLAIVSCLTVTQLGFAGGGAPNKDKDVQAFQMNCGPGMSNCTKTVISTAQNPGGLNAVGDKVNYNTAGVSVENLGTISETKNVQMKSPTSGMKIYSFTPSKGHRLVAGKPVKILFVTFDLNEPFPAGTPESVVKEGTEAKTKNNARNKMIKVYKQLPGETQWEELIAYYTPEKNLSDLKPIELQLNPDGKAIAPDVVGNHLEADLGQVR